MKSERLVELVREVAGQDAEEVPDALDGHGPYLLGLRLGVAIEAGGARIEEHLERVDQTDLAPPVDRWWSSERLPVRR